MLSKAALLTLAHSLPHPQVKGVADAGSAAVRVSGMELGGLFGSLLAGRLSDFLVRKFPNDGAVGKRVQVSLLFPCVIARCWVAAFCPLDMVKASQCADEGVVGGLSHCVCHTTPMPSYSDTKLVAYMQVVMAYTVGVAAMLVGSSVTVTSRHNSHVLALHFKAPMVQAHESARDSSQQDLTILFLRMDRRCLQRALPRQ